ncbi:hypothetical protein ACNQVK_32730 [Mycobacterium sp. 134]|uniref:hypothetical protein n=1 Tax=Mycobacterium sp. 134 TaxID=3400425 RepID=UPI003AAAE81C
MTEIRQPENWKNRTVVLTLAFLMFGGMLVACVVMTVNALQRDDDVYAVISGGFALTIGGVLLGCALGAVGSVRLRAVSTEAGTTLRCATGTMLCFGTTGIALALTATFYLICAQDRDDLPLMNPENPGDAIWTMVILLIITVIALVWYLVKGRTPLLRLGPHSVTYVDGTSSRTESWDGITDITDVPPNRNSRHPICLVRKYDRAIVIENASFYAPSGAALYWMVRHYWLHPENRMELTDGRALERLRTEDFFPE